MADECCKPNSAGADNPRYRRILWAALVINALMFVVEIITGLQSGSVSLLADAIDFAGDAANYGLSLAVLSMALRWRARAALIKGTCMTGYGLFIVGKSVFALASGAVPEPFTMGVVAIIALVANVTVAAMLYAWREGDANMRSVWLCSRNDAIGNAAVMLAALGVFGTGSNWPDILVAAVMAWLAITAGTSVMREARQELRQSAA